MKITVKTFFGLENVLRDELNELGYDKVEVFNRAVQLQGTWEDVYRLNLCCRCALSVLVELSHFRIKNQHDLYQNAKAITWDKIFAVNKTFAIKGVVNSTLFKHSQFPMLVIKDAVVDFFREKIGKRPSVDLQQAQVVIDLHINESQVSISLNTSGVPLYQRGYRQHTGEAPLNEVLAAGMLRLAKWDVSTPLLDPFCGSGTFYG